MTSSNTIACSKFKKKFAININIVMHAERDIVMANLSVCLSVTLWLLYRNECAISSNSIHLW